MKTKIFTLALFAVLITSCNRPVYEYYLFTDVDKQMIPYELGQTVSFIDSEEQPFILTVTRNTTSSVSERMMDNFYIVFSERIVNLQSENLRIKLYVVGKNPKDKYNVIDVFIGIGVEVNEPYCRIYYDKEGNFLEQGDNSIHDSIDIDGKVYYDVVECNTNTSLDWQPTIPTQFFYNKTYGILQINRDGENFCTLKE